MKKWKNEHVNIYMRRQAREKGFTLVELIIVIAIMAVLVGVGAPMFMKTMAIRQADACTANREAIMAIFERCIVEEWTSFSATNFEAVGKGEFAKVKEEVYQYSKCPNGGTYTYTIVGDTAKITCNHGSAAAVIKKHDDVVTFEWKGWGGTDPEESDDNALTPPETP